MPKILKLSVEKKQKFGRENKRPISRAIFRYKKRQPETTSSIVSTVLELVESLSVDSSFSSSEPNKSQRENYAWWRKRLSRMLSILEMISLGLDVLAKHPLILPITILFTLPVCMAVLDILFISARKRQLARLSLPLEQSSGEAPGMCPIITARKSKILLLEQNVTYCLD